MIRTISFLFISIFSLNVSAADIICVRETKNDSCTVRQTVQERVSVYEKLISAGNVYAARQFMQDGEAISLSKENGKYPYFKSHVYALIDLEDLVGRGWNDNNFNKLSIALAQRMYKDSVLSTMGIGYEPEKLLVWIRTQKLQFNDEKNLTVKKAIREWNTVFGNVETKSIEWNQAMDSVSKADWQNLTITNRNSYLLKLMEREPAFLIYKDEDEAEMSVSVSSAEVQAMMDKAINSGMLTKEEITELQAARSDDFRLIQLSKIFDGSNKIFTKDEMMKINANRRVKMRYGVKPANFEQMSMLLSYSVTQEIKGTAAGDHVLENGPIKIRLANVKDSYSSLDKDGTIAIDLELVGKFLQIKGYPAETLLSGPNSKERLAELSRYISPLAVYEGMHRRQQEYMNDNNIYKPGTQEDEIEASSLESMYFIEKMRTDEAFERSFMEIRNYNVFAMQQISNAYALEMDTYLFEDNIRERCSDLPTKIYSYSEILAFVSEELDSRKNQDSHKKGEELDVKDVLNSPLDRTVVAIRNARTEDLVRLQETLLNEDTLSYYRESSALIDRLLEKI